MRRGLVTAAAGLLAAAAVALGVHAEHWAVIVVGSRGYENYRHQADACHAYHVVRRHGIPAENVILMMYDDVASAPENPFPGRLYNRPSDNATGEAAMEVYAGCEVTYRGEEVTPAMFLSVLRGDATATKGKPVLESTGSDRVFINFIDHGARGFVVFPHGQMLTSKQLTNALYKMHEQKRYKELVFYVEACHSGSMFWSWSMSHINAFVTTAANGWESSWGTYCPPADVVNGVAMNTCLGDLYSVNWMEDSDRTDLSSESLQRQFQLTKRETTRSHVEEFGSSRVRREIVGNFQSNYDQSIVGVEEDATHALHEATRVPDRPGSVASHDVDLVTSFYKYLRSTSTTSRSELADQLIAIVHARETADRMMETIRSVATQVLGENVRPVPRLNRAISSEVCIASIVDVFDSHVRYPRELIPGFTSYSIQYLGELDDICQRFDHVVAFKAFLVSAVMDHGRFHHQVPQL